MKTIKIWHLFHFVKQMHKYRITNYFVSEMGVSEKDYS